MSNYIPIVFALDDGYAMPTAVAITSLILNKKSDTKYKIYLIAPSLSNTNKSKLLSLQNYNCEIYIIENNDALVSYTDRLANVTTTDYFRLILPKFINEKKVIALDGDIIVLEDLTELYNIDLEENIVGGCYFRPHDIYNREYVQNTLTLDEGKRINIGVMLMNLEKIKNEGLEKDFTDKIGYFKVMSEDIINFVCKNRIKYIPIKYNYNLHFYKYHKLLKNDPVYTQKEYKLAEKSPTIFHYTLSKPWKKKNIKRFNLWYHYYKLSPYKSEKINFNIERNLFKKLFNILKN